MTMRRAFYGSIVAGALIGSIVVCCVGPLRVWEGAIIGACVGYMVFYFGSGLREFVVLIGGVIRWVCGIRAKEHRCELAALATELAPVLRGSHDVTLTGYIENGELGLALEMMSDWCIDAEPPITLSADVLNRFFRIGESMGLRKSWVDLLPLVRDSEFGGLNPKCLSPAKGYLREELSADSARWNWLERVQSAVQGIEDFHAKSEPLR